MRERGREVNNGAMVYHLFLVWSRTNYLPRASQIYSPSCSVLQEIDMYAMYQQALYLRFVLGSANGGTRRRSEGGQGKVKVYILWVPSCLVSMGWLNPWPKAPFSHTFSGSYNLFFLPLQAWRITAPLCCYSLRELYHALLISLNSSYSFGNSPFMEFSSIDCF